MKTIHKEDFEWHLHVVKELSNHALRCIDHDLRHNSTTWAKYRREAALNELQKRGVK